MGKIIQCIFTNTKEILRYCTTKSFLAIISFIGVTTIPIIGIYVCFLFSPAPTHSPVQFEINKIEEEAPLQISMVIIIVFYLSLYTAH